MKTERELFSDWARINIENYCDAQFSGKHYVVRDNSRLTKEKKNFLILSLNVGLKSWQSATQREGFKLVPVGDYNELVRSNRYKHEQNIELSKEVKILRERKKYYKSKCKAMIGVCDD